MKHKLLLSILSALPLFLQAAVAEHPKDIRLEEGKISAAYGATVTLFQDDFAQDTGKWVKPYRIYQKFSWLHYGPTNGVPTFRIDRNPEVEHIKVRLFDTAWGITTKKITLPEKANLWFLTIHAYSNQPEMVNASGSVGYGTFISWYDKDGKRITRTRFFFNVANKFAARTQHEGKIPAGAVSADISLGADLPDLQPKEYVAFSGLKFDVAEKNADFKKYGFFETAPIRNGDKKIAWEAKTPEGTAIGYQVAYASGKTPTEWTTFAGPDGKSDRWFTKPGTVLDGKKGDWAKLRIRLTTAGQVTPVLSSLSIGDSVISDWNCFEDKDVPVITRVSASPCEDAMKPCVFRINDANPIKWDKLKVSYFTDSDKRGKPLNPQDISKQVTVTVKGDLVSFLPKGGFKKGLNFFRVEAEDLLGNRSSEDLVLFIAKRRTSNIVTMRDDGMTLVDGKPFFPIGMACAVKDQLNGNSYDRLFEMFQEAGMNFARHYSAYGKHAKDSPEYFAAAAKHGVKLYCSAGYGANETRIPMLAKSLANQLDAPNIAWDTGDDTSMHITKEQMRTRYMAVKAIDPDRITTQADPLGPFYGTRYRPYALYSDNFSPEIYSVHNASEQDKNQSIPTVISSMKAIHRDVAAVKAPTRSCWPLIHYFYNCGNWTRLPDYTELKAMAFQAVIHGAQGIIFYRYAGYKQNNKTGFTKAQWNTVASVAKDLRKVYDVLCARAAKVQPAVKVLSGPQMDVQENSSVSVLLKEHNGKRYLFAGNGVRKPVTATVTVANAKGGKEVYSGKQFTADGNGTFNLEFKPLEILVIELD